ncbi:MAG: phage tail protein [Bilophila wadsworthia]
MGVGLIIAAVTIGATVATTLFAKGPRSTKGADMAPANLDAFRLTTAEEGTVIPRVFGTVRLPGNLLYYGNLSSEPEYEETTVGGKGGKKKKQKVLQGYHYRMDVWQGIGMGPLELVGVYQDDRLLTEQGGAISCAEQVWNNGTGAFYPAQAGPYASRLPGVSHIWLRQFYLGFNVSMMPTLHYVVRFCGDIPLEHAILSNGVNPAAIILQLLLDAGASWSSIDKPSFSAAASFWAQKGYGLNIVFSRQKPVRDHIMQVLGAVGGWLIERADGTLSLRAPDPDVAPSATLGEGDFLEGSFSFKRAAWDTTWNDLSGKFTDAAQDYSERAVTANNAASIQLLGLRRKKSVDLTAFTDRSAAQRRIEELRDVESYPAASFSFDVSRDYAHIEQGQILEITHPRFGLSGVRVRVLEVVRGNLSENRISIQARQVVERLSGTFVPPGETLPDPMAPPTVVYPPVTGIPPWSAPDLSPVPLRHARLFELPRNPETGSEPVVLVLAARELLSEEGVLVERSATNADYSPVGLLSAPWAQYGTLAEAYPASTLAVDDTQGLLYRPYKEDPAFGPVSRTDLFGARRMALVGDELMLFQTVVLEGSETTRLSGVVRGYEYARPGARVGSGDMGIPESGRGKHGAGTVHRHAQHQTAARFGRRGARRGSGGSPVSRRDRKGDGPVARRRAAGGTHGGFRRRKLEPGGRCFRRGRDAHRERERAGARRILRGFRPYGGGYGACGQRHVHHPYALGTLRAVRDGAAARVCFPGGIRHRGIAGRGIRGLSRAFQRIRTQRHVSRGRSSGPSGPAAIWGSGPAKQARRRRNGEFDPDRA